MPLYLWLNLVAIAVPFILSFEKNLRFYKKWPFLFAATFLMMIPFIVWDHHFVTRQYWGFNPNYLVGLYLFSLPIEEILFFIVVPYASLFAFYAIRFHFPKFVIPRSAGTWITIILSIASIIIFSLNLARPYTATILAFFAIVLISSFFTAKPTLFAFYAVFPVLLVPFFIMNGILTGTGIVDKVVWYNPNAFMGFRILTIPVEDIFYAFSMILLVLVLKEWLEKIWTPQK